jgi:hypothetical protein
MSTMKKLKVIYTACTNTASDSYAKKHHLHNGHNHSFYAPIVEAQTSVPWFKGTDGGNIHWNNFLLMSK